MQREDPLQRERGRGRFGLGRGLRVETAGSLEPGDLHKTEMELEQRRTGWESFEF